MQIVIEIPENQVPDCQEIISMNLHFIHKEVCVCTYPFKVLPEHHGRLIDVDELLDDIGLEDNDENRVCNTGEIITLEDIDRISIIIPATKEGDKE